MRKKHAQMDFGTCPRMLCRATAVIPLGIRDEPKVCTIIYTAIIYIYYIALVLLMYSTGADDATVWFSTCLCNVLYCVVLCCSSVSSDLDTE
jgi:Casein kinase II regulatory subunit